ncbi:MAG: ABC transporter ATP-binding protein [Candidatus Nanoarchaeia archaeon]
MTSRNSNIIKLKNVWKTYKMGDVDVHALRGISVDIKKGELVSIIGPSGSGKSTLMNLVGCLDLPTRGSVYLDGKNIAHMEEAQLARIRGKKLGFIFQTFNLISTLTAQENVALPMMFRGRTQRERMERAAEILKLVDLGDRMHHKPNELSGGQRQRVAIARSMANDPELLLCDEPTGNLDSKTGKSIMDILKRLHKKEKKTIVLITHDSNLSKLTERTIVIKDGNVVKRK